MAKPRSRPPFPTPQSPVKPVVFDPLGDALRAIERAHTAPTPPHSALLLIARAPGGFVLLDPDVADGRTYELSPCQAAAVAATPDALAAQVTAWATAQPPATPAEAA